MPNFVYFAILDESISILRDLCLQGFRIIAQSGPVDRPSLPSFDTVTSELEAILRATPTFYLAGSFTRFPVQFNLLSKKSDAPEYLINHLVEGPLMQGMVGRLKSVNGVPKLLPGSISYQKEYQNPETGQWHEPSPEVLAAFKKAVALMKKHWVPLKDVPGAVIAPEALKLLQTGQAQLG
jgi:hypothetical protein